MTWKIVKRYKSQSKGSPWTMSTILRAFGELGELSSDGISGHRGRGQGGQDDGSCACRAGTPEGSCTPRVKASQK